jgi:hypothetical protein
MRQGLCRPPVKVDIFVYFYWRSKLCRIDKVCLLSCVAAQPWRTGGQRGQPWPRTHGQATGVATSHSTIRVRACDRIRFVRQRSWRAWAATPRRHNTGRCLFFSKTICIGSGCNRPVTIDVFKLAVGITLPQPKMCFVRLFLNWRKWK